MKCLVLGAAGFIGSNLVKELEKNLFELTLFDKKINDKPKCETTCKLVEGDFSPEYDFESLVKDQDIIYHLISTTTPNSNVTLKNEITDNVFSTLALLDACVKEKVKKIIFISSGGTVYGESEGVPFEENSDNNPICSYGIQKLIIEKYLYLYYHKYSLDYSVIRLSNPYGPGQNPKGSVGAVSVFLDRMMNDEIITLYGDGSCVRDYIYIDDAVKGIVNISKLESKDKLFNLGSGVGTSLKDIIKYLEAIMGKKANVVGLPKRINDLEYSVLNISRYKKYFPELELIDISRGIKLLVDYRMKASELEGREKKNG